MDSGHANALHLVKLFCIALIYLLSILNMIEQVAIMLSGMGTSSTDVFRMVSVTHRLLKILSISILKICVLAYITIYVLSPLT